MKSLDYMIINLNFLLIFINFVDITSGQTLDIEIKRRKKHANHNITTYLSFLDTNIPVQYNDKYQLIADIKVGSFLQTSEVLLDTGSNILWIAGTDCIPCEGIKNRFDHTKSKTYKNTTQKLDIVYGTGSTQGYLSYDTVKLGDLVASQFKFLLSYDSGHDMFSDGILGLGNFYSNEESSSLSIIDQLYSQKRISKRIFSQKLYDDEKGVLTLGDIPDEIKNRQNNSKLNYGTCDCLSKSIVGRPNIYWECELNHIFFGNNANNSIEINSRLNFDTGTNFVLVPSFFLKKRIMEGYLKYYFDRELCVATPINNFIQIVCDTSLRYTNLENFNFRFGEFVIVMKPEELFDNFGKFLQFKISSSMDQALDMWILGAPVLMKFTMVFNKEDQQIGFFGEDVKNVGQIDDQNETLIIILVIAFGVLIIALIVMLIKYFESKKSQNFNNYYKNMNVNESEKRNHIEDYAHNSNIVHNNENRRYPSDF